MKIAAHSSRPVNTGTVLLLAMLFLLLVGLVAGSVMQTSALEFRMAANDQYREQSLQRARAVADAIFQNEANFIIDGTVGGRLCQSGNSDDACADDRFIVIAADIVAGLVDASLEYYVERQGPLYTSTLPARRLQGAGVSSRAYEAALFEIHVLVDGGNPGRGGVELVQGVARLISTPSQGGLELSR